MTPHRLRRNRQPGRLRHNSGVSSPTPLEPPVAEGGLERERFELERTRVLRELEFKSRELEMREREMAQPARSANVTPLTATLIAGLVGLLGTGIGAYMQGRSNQILERQTFEAQLIIKAVDTDDHTKAARNLSFLVNAGLVQDANGRIAKLIKNPTSLPVRNVSSRFGLIDVDNDTFEQEVIQSALPVVVLFSARWAMPAQAMEDSVARLAASTSGVKIRLLDVDENKNIAKRYNVEALPVIIVFHHGVEQRRILGHLSPVELEKLIADLQKQTNPR